MARTPDRTPGPSIEEELRLQDKGVDPAVTGGVVYKNGNFIMRDSLGNFNPRTGVNGANGLCFAVFTTDGGIVYDTAGSPALKAVA